MLNTVWGHTQVIKHWKHWHHFFLSGVCEACAILMKRKWFVYEHWPCVAWRFQESCPLVSFREFSFLLYRVVPSSLALKRSTDFGMTVITLLAAMVLVVAKFYPNSVTCIVQGLLHVATYTTTILILVLLLLALSSLIYIF